MALAFVSSLTLMLQTSGDYPTKPVRLIEPFGAGGGPDLVSRALAQTLTEFWGQPVTVENVPGAQHEFATLPGVVEDVTDGRVRAGCQVPSRWIHVARQHQRSGIQRRAAEEPAV